MLKHLKKQQEYKYKSLVQTRVHFSHIYNLTLKNGHCLLLCNITHTDTH